MSAAWLSQSAALLSDSPWKVIAKIRRLFHLLPLATHMPLSVYQWLNLLPVGHRHRFSFYCMQNVHLLNCNVCFNMAKYVLNMKHKQLQSCGKLQTQHSLYGSLVQSQKRRKQDSEVLEKWEKIAWKKENILPHVPFWIYPEKKSIPAYSLNFPHEIRKENPSFADDKDNVIARLTVLGYMMFVSLETSPFERQQGQLLRRDQKQVKALSRLYCLCSVYLTRWKEAWR